MASHNMHYLYNVEYFEPLYGFRGDISKLGNAHDNVSDDISDNVHDNTSERNSSEVEADKKFNKKFEENNKVIENFTYGKECAKAADTLCEKLKKAELGAGFKYKEFELFTSYPGLLLGTGYEHDISAKSGITCGFSLDYVTGLPVIPGSTLKGMLRSYFPEKGKVNEQEKKELIKSVMTQNDNFKSENIPYEKLVNDIFEEDGKTDIFMGAYPIISDKEKIFAKEYITPHKGLQDPNPIMLLKVRANVKYRFIFMLKDSTGDNGDIWLSADEKAELFKKLILIGGIGAKTNIGFGRFVEDELQTAGNSAVPVCANSGCNNTVVYNNKAGCYYKYCKSCSDKYKKEHGTRREGSYR